MDVQKQQNDWALGFLSVRHHPSCGYFGGYLVVNALARPLEFHCTLPLLPTRSQQILYGATLEEFVCGEQIGRALVQRAKCKPRCILCDSATSLSLRHVERIPVAAIQMESTASSGGLRRPTSERSDCVAIRVEACHLSLLRDYESDSEHFREVLEGIAEKFDVHEPFSRIEEALMEANPIARAA